MPSTAKKGAVTRTVTVAEPELDDNSLEVCRQAVAALPVSNAQQGQLLTVALAQIEAKQRARGINRASGAVVEDAPSE